MEEQIKQLITYFENRQVPFTTKEVGDVVNYLKAMQPVPEKATGTEEVKMPEPTSSKKK